MPEAIADKTPAAHVFARKAVGGQAAARRSPLDEPLGGRPRTLRVDGRDCMLREMAFPEMCIVRGDAADGAFGAAVLQATGMVLPRRPNGASIDPQRQLLWLGPDEWLFKSTDGQGAAVASALRSALQGLHSAVVDVGDGFTTLDLRGPAAAGLLSRGCPLDLHARAFPQGALAQSHIAKANVVLLCLQAGSHYELTVRRSFAGYLYGWFMAAGD
jgi:sarcosine oxidase subunit gamma